MFLKYLRTFKNHKLGTGKIERWWWKTDAVYMRHCWVQSKWLRECQYSYIVHQTLRLVLGMDYDCLHSHVQVWELLLLSLHVPVSHSHHQFFPITQSQIPVSMQSQPRNHYSDLSGNEDVDCLFYYNNTKYLKITNDFIILVF